MWCDDQLLVVCTVSGVQRAVRQLLLLQAEALSRGCSCKVPRLPQADCLVSIIGLN
jgi:hypothetical protein